MQIASWLYAGDDGGFRHRFSLSSRPADEAGRDPLILKSMGILNNACILLNFNNKNNFNSGSLSSAEERGRVRSRVVDERDLSLALPCAQGRELHTTLR